MANPDDMIITAWCSCMAGASRCCNHVIAMLYKVEYANANNFALLLVHLCHMVGTNQQKNHRIEKDKWNCCTKKDEIKHGR